MTYTQFCELLSVQLTAIYSALQNGRIIIIIYALTNISLKHTFLNRFPRLRVNSSGFLPAGISVRNCNPSSFRLYADISEGRCDLSTSTYNRKLLIITAHFSSPFQVTSSLSLQGAVVSARQTAATSNETTVCWAQYMFNPKPTSLPSSAVWLRCKM